jgi:hypothetical protein
MRARATVHVIADGSDESQCFTILPGDFAHERERVDLYYTQSYYSMYFLFGLFFYAMRSRVKHTGVVLSFRPSELIFITWPLTPGRHR